MQESDFKISIVQRVQEEIEIVETDKKGEKKWEFP